MPPEFSVAEPAVTIMAASIPVMRVLLDKMGTNRESNDCDLSISFKLSTVRSDSRGDPSGIRAEDGSGSTHSRLKESESCSPARSHSDSVT